MRFTPATIDVPAGDNLVIDLENSDSAQVHDLVVGEVSSKRLSPGEKTTVNVGVLNQSVTAHCSVVGHENMGMVLQIKVTGLKNQVVGGSEGGELQGHHMHQMGGGANALAMPPADTPLSTTIVPELPALGEERVHKIRLEARELPLEVAPGVWQQRWTFNGRSVGPTLHGRVGDTFEVTLVNHGTMGHSLDFHAGVLSPDEPMRTIPPGKSLVYRFTAPRVGIWMYHCSTMPMSAHIAGGMHGAVVIEPPNMPPVDHTYVMVQSEIYLQNVARTPKDARAVADAKVGTGMPDRMAFNGIANQYDQKPLQVRPGERVRVWVLDAGPNRASAFHVIGTQFDVTWTEGIYGVNRQVGVGAQMLPLLPAQGGFVEMTFPQPGHYAFVSHIMSDAERGAHGTFLVR
ncbi:MAG: multicopper oxidase domain-containing protein [Actinomycetaceae bacterium]|nr:multicopper oxidase domain-containing protein [Actinomycetaceae bacterium]